MTDEVFPNDDNQEQVKTSGNVVDQTEQGKTMDDVADQAARLADDLQAWRWGLWDQAKTEVQAAHRRVQGQVERAEKAEAERDKARDEVVYLRELLKMWQDSHRELRVMLDQVRDAVVDGGHDDTCAVELSPGAGYPCNCWKADLTEILDGQAQS